MIDPFRYDYLQEAPHKRLIRVSPMQVQLIRHATLFVHINGVKLLVDPMLSPKGSMEPVSNAGNHIRIPMVDLPISETQVQTLVQTADAILVTHLHRDHWDEAATQLIPKQTPVFCQPGDENQIREKGFTVVEPVIDCLDWQGIQIYRTGGQHGTGEIGQKMGKVSGFVLKKPGVPKLYIAGDTIWCDEVQLALEKHRPVVVVFNAGTAQFMSGDPITMTAADVKQVHQAAPKAKLVAVHMDTINHCRLSRQELKNFIRQENVAQKIYIPNDGEILSF
jgi:L-ascorbate metabolism protein UlaG (beta-lactamase superfamily)